MKSRVYTIEELLNARSSAVPDLLAGLASQDDDIAIMFGNRSRGNSLGTRNYNSNSLKRDRKKTLDSSSNTSDEVVFRGTLNRRSTKQEPDPITEIKAIAPAVSTSESDQPMEWKYRGRSGSEIMTTEPLSAPAGLNAQQSEGFQRFYKAVVSPTHVRVTAGGRIVPNTRNPVSPTAKRPKDAENYTNGEKPEPQPASAFATKQPAPPPPIVGIPQPIPFFYPGFPGMHPMAGMPMPMMPPGFPFPMPMPNAPPPPTLARTQDPSRKENQNKKPDDDKAAPDSAKSGVKLSPPEQFDHSKPFVYNGQQWMFPMFPAPFTGMFGIPPPAYAGPMAGPHMMMPPHMAVPPMMGPMGTVPPQQAITATMMNHASVGPSSRQTTTQPPSKPPISSIRPSQITRKQIDGLRANLKYHEDQLQYNKHQIDEKDMENKIQLLNHDIDRFEKVFRAQVEYEEKHYPKADKGTEEVSSSSGRSTAPSSKTQSQSEESKESKVTTLTNASHSQPDKPKKKERSCDSVGLNSNKSSTASYTFEEDTARDRLLGSIHPGKKSSLPSGAALAPVFQPRSVSNMSCTVPNPQGQPWQQSADAEEGITQEQLEAAEKRLLAVGAKAWNLPQDANHHLSNHSSHAGSPRGLENLGVPYLVGTLPRGVNPYAGRRIEYDYSRKLTDEEVQARHLYWGKAPRSVGQGLPKYDGKNFYPPSPVKQLTPSKSPSSRRARLPAAIQNIDHAFEASYAHDIDPFRAVTASDKPTLLRTEGNGLQSTASSVKSTQSFSSHAADVSGEFKKALAESITIQEIEGSRDSRASHGSRYSHSISETKSADYHDVRSNGAGSKLWQGMLKRGLTSSDVLPSTVTSMTAQGYLPQFSSHTTASLGLSISGTICSPNHALYTKDAETNPNGSTFMAPKTGENAALGAPECSSISDTIRNMVGMKSPARAH